MTSFSAETTADEVVAGMDLAGKRVFVTGVSSGIGLATAQALAGRGAEVTGAVRDPVAARNAAAGIDPDHLELIELDLGSLASVRACAERMVVADRSFDLIIANAGVIALEGRTADGFEPQFGINHLGHFLLINRMAGLLRPGSRIVVVGSLGHRFADVDLDDPNLERRPGDYVAAYGASKTANLLFAKAFDERHRARGIRAVSLHPGDTQTNVARHMGPEHTACMFAAMVEIAGPDAVTGHHLKTPGQGAATSLWAGLFAPGDMVGGQFCMDCAVAPRNDAAQGWFGYRSYALDPDRAEALWALSEAMVGERFPRPA